MNEVTTHMRTYKRVKKELKLRFPGVREADLIQMLYNTSTLNIDIEIKKK